MRNAHRINRGMLPECVPESDFSMTEFADEELAADYITNLYAGEAESEGWQTLQILSPMHKGPCGVQNLNRLLQARVNPPSPAKEEIQQPGGTVLRLGDKVMQIRNNYEKDVYNGDIGQYPDRADGECVTYEEGETDELQLAYAMSVHKSQGSEYSRVVLALVPGHYIMLQRNLLYTAVTRAREKVELVGTKAALQTAVANDRTRRRYSLLKERLQESGDL